MHQAGPPERRAIRGNGKWEDPKAGKRPTVQSLQIGSQIRAERAASDRAAADGTRPAQQLRITKWRKTEKLGVLMAPLSS